MSNTEAGAAWSFDESNIEHSRVQDIKADAPLQYAALFAESQPEDGKVGLNKLSGILARARISNEKSTEILAACSEKDGTHVSELDFYWALAQIAAFQANASHKVERLQINEPAPTLMLAEIQLYELGDNDDHNNNGDSSGEWEVPNYNPTAEPLISVSLLTKNAGSFFLKHAVYSVDGHFDNKSVKVLRRYRDFASLASYLSKRYPFRALPVLPPKRLTMNGKYLVGDSQDAFLKRRAAGLTRFLNLLLQHPILNKDNLIEAFLFADTQFDAKLTYSRGPLDEMAGKAASPLFISQWSASTLEKWRGIETATHEYVNQITALCVIMEKQHKRIESEMFDVETIGRSFVALSRSIEPLYADQREDLDGIQQRLESVAKYTDASHAQSADDLKQITYGPLFELKLYRDMLSSVNDLFNRLKAQGGNTIPEQQKQIAATQRRLLSISTKEDAKEEELHKLRMKIQQAQSSICDQTNRDWVIKMIVDQETQMVQSMQYQLSKILRSLANYLSNSKSKHAELASQFADSASSAPLRI